MTNATDIITYIGVPLAVLGVLPIIYTFLHSRLTTRAIRRSLARHGLSHATTRSSLMSSVVEVSLPRVLITPLSRSSPRYWAVNRTGAAGMRGGTWTTMHWNTLVMGSKLYRVQYSEDLRVPQAEVELGQLLGFLLDRGAVPDAKGLRMLRVSGLWTPTGTSVMLSPDARHSALRVSVPDDSDGVLSLALRWEAEWDEREPESLPPEWMRLEVPKGGIQERARDETEYEGDQPGGRREPEEMEKETQEVDLLGVDHESKDNRMVRVEKTIASKSCHHPEPTSLRFRLSSSSSTSHSTTTTLTICMATWESSHAPLPYSPPLMHLHSGPASVWFPIIALSLGLSKSLPLYTYNLPSSLYSLATKDTIPCGVLVLLGLLAAESAPDWETKYDPLEDSRAHHNNFLAKQRSIAAERMMGAEQARVARIAREAAELHQIGEEFRARMARQRERETRREREAFASGRLEARMVADAATEWLMQEKILREGAATQEAVEGLLVRMVKQEEVAMGVFALLERWKEWSDRGGMNTEDLAVFRADKVAFCYAVCVMALFKEVCAKEESSLAADMQECIRCWKTVRLG